MGDVRERRRVLVAVRADERAPLFEVFGRPALADWEVVETNSFPQARFVQQHDACDVLLVDEGLYRGENGTGLAWLAELQDEAVVLLSEPEPELIAGALRQGVGQWLPRGLALDHPPLLAAALRQGLRWDEPRRRARLAALALQECRRQVHRLVGRLWETTPDQSAPGWFSQRYVLERLQEEVVRAKRYGAPLSILVGEVEAPGDESEVPPAAWTTQRVLRAKRRCDVAGQYGPNGFLLLLGHTPESGAATCRDRLRQLLHDRPGMPQGPHSAVRSHFGIATFSEATPTAQALLRCAEQRLDQSRAAGGAAD
jgi:hypothetical protein